MNSYNRQKYVNAAKEMLADNVFKHSLALEPVWEGFTTISSPIISFRKTNPKKEDWMLAGLLHDIAYWGETKADHPLKVNEVLAKYDLKVNDTVNHIIKTHGPSITNIYPKKKAEWSIFCADSLTGLITAVALVYPSKKLADVKLPSVMKRFLKQPKFAAGTRREDIKQCVLPGGLNLSLDKFVEICLKSMQIVAYDLGF